MPLHEVFIQRDRGCWGEQEEWGYVSGGVERCCPSEREKRRIINFYFSLNESANGNDLRKYFKLHKVPAFWKDYYYYILLLQNIFTSIPIFVNIFTRFERTRFYINSIILQFINKNINK